VPGGNALIFAGIDIGSTTTEAVLIDECKGILAKAQVLTGYALDEASDKAVGICCADAGCKQSDFTYCVSTGYGRDLVEYAQEKYTEIACHAKGANFCFPEARAVIDIGGQDSKAIAINEFGGIVDFSMNDKCAAGTGRFLEVMASIMGLSAEEMGRQSLLAENDVKISSICTVFAESEVISLLAKKSSSPYDIMAGIHGSVVRRVNMLVQKARLAPPIVMTGGVALNVGVVSAFEKLLGFALLIPEDPQSVGALGAAVIALERYKKTSQLSSETLG
jgi:predicted CoA-substrate-specific enzyme activase